MERRKYIGYYESQPEAMMALAEYHKNGVDADLTKSTVEAINKVEVPY